ncbi:hypothetical protein HZF08_05115 [Paenibacillus sp. CGMCC 1.16610]|uniref:Uncharacterized protein n=1 Tax=Paenibacillus anseongense TaxID=2682845 RepID=A0ABW9UDB2_9BACL|nr:MULTISPECIES: DUF6454 family protein [Paenibacillus]MBA2937675.1 hypothetical protein [Paenibacillus sp. CGMCC 1.16610]MVQ36733.1 hypothetical protein [Paenibacillus anseongense]
MDDQNLIAGFKKLTRSTKWVLKNQIELQFNNYHSQGMVRIGDFFYMSSVELIEWPIRYDQAKQGHDRTSGKGIGHIFVFDRQGKLVKETSLGEGDMYHPGGIDFDGTYIWVPVAEYRPHSQSIVYKMNPLTLKAEESFRVQDHIGGLVREGQNGKLIGNSWGSRKFYVWDSCGRQLLDKENMSHFIDYQDGQYVGDGKMIVSGISELVNPASKSKPFELGGLALIDLFTLETLHEIPITEISPQGHVITRNPVFLEIAAETIRLYAVPDDNDGSMLIYEAAI